MKAIINKKIKLIKKITKIIKKKNRTIVMNKMMIKFIDNLRK